MVAFLEKARSNWTNGVVERALPTPSRRFDSRSPTRTTTTTPATISLSLFLCYSDSIDPKSHSFWFIRNYSLSRMIGNSNQQHVGDSRRVALGTRVPLGRRGTKDDAKPTPKPSSSLHVTFPRTTPLDKENGPGIRRDGRPTTTATKTSTTGSGSSARLDAKSTTTTTTTTPREVSFRSVLRATVTPRRPRQSTVPSRLPPHTPSVPAPGRHQIATTPRSLLTNELELLDGDDTFLCSPAVGTPRLPLPTFHMPEATPAIQESAKAVEGPVPSMEPTRSTQHPRLPPVVPAVPISVPNSQAPSTRPPVAEPRMRPQASRQLPTTNRTVVSRVEAPPPSTQSRWARNRLSTYPTPSPTPFTPRGVCMDLSDMFQDASFSTRATAHKSASRAHVPHSVTSRRALLASVAKPTPADTSLLDNEQDHDWADQQCQAFSSWLNYTFTPSEDKDHEAALASETTHERGVALRTLVLHQRMAQARRSALALFHTDPVLQKSRQRLLQEISKGKLRIRPDRDLAVNLTLRNQAVALCLSYSTPWLRLGLETLFGESILPSVPHHFSPHGNPVASRKVPTTRMKAALQTFLIQRVLSDDHVLAKYTKGLCKVPSGSFETKYRAEIRNLALYRLLLLFLFLDRAKENNLLDKAPRLFAKTASVKSTREVLLTFCRDFLSSEGDFVKHLSRMGIQVHYKQEPVDELDFTITNLAVDLRDGVRLARLLEILSHAPRKSLLVKLRLPAVSRLQKLHNVGLVLRRFRNMGVPLSDEVVAHHIVDGHREMVLKLMWAVVAHCCLNDLVNVHAVEAEIARVERAHRQAVVYQNYEPDVKVPSVLEELHSLLLRWCHAVCSTLGTAVRNLTTDFADGRAICLLIHYYHPALLRLSEIRPTSRFSPRSLTQVRALENEMYNSQLANTRMSELGGIPRIVPECDTNNVPEAKSMLLCLSFLCSRLLESSTEIRAILLIQNRYRAYRKARLRRRQRVVARFLWQVWQSHKHRYYANQAFHYGPAVRIIERFVRNGKERLRELCRHRVLREDQEHAAVLLQVSVAIVRTKLFTEIYHYF